MPFFSPVGGGGIGKATATASTGSPTIDTSSRSGKTIYKFTGSGSITIGTAGYVEILVVGGGGGTANGNAGGGGGAGGYIYNTSAFLPSGTHTVNVGAGSSGSSTWTPFQGDASRVGPYIAVGGGAGAAFQNSGSIYIARGNGGSGGGGAGNTTAAGGAAVASSVQGNPGGNGATGNGGGGGGAGGGGGSGVSSTSSGAGGAGLANSITGTSVTYAGGGGGNGTTSGAGGSGGGGAGNAAAGTANTGGGGGASNWSGGSGYVVVVIG